jgi:hypothetical protein
MSMPSEQNYGNVPPTTPGGSTTGNKMADVASQLKAKASDLGHSVSESIEGSRKTAAGGLESAASSLHQRADQLPGGQGVASFAHKAADKLTTTANYIRDHDVDAVVEDVKALLKAHPGPALFGATVIGFLLGRSFTSRD